MSIWAYEKKVFEKSFKNDSWIIEKSLVIPSKCEENIWLVIARGLINPNQTKDSNAFNEIFLTWKRRTLFKRITTPSHLNVSCLSFGGQKIQCKVNRYKIIGEYFILTLISCKPPDHRIQFFFYYNLSFSSNFTIIDDRGMNPNIINSTTWLPTLRYDKKIWKSLSGRCDSFKKVINFFFFEKSRPVKKVNSKT